MHQIFHLSTVGCFTPARGKSGQKNRDVSRVKPLHGRYYAPPSDVIGSRSFLAISLVHKNVNINMKF